MTPERKSIELDMKSAGLGEVEAIIARLDIVDGHRDAYLPDAFTDGQRVALEGPEHATAKRGEIPLGMAVLAVVGGKEVRIRGYYNMRDPVAAAEYERVSAAGPQQQWSFAFRAVTAPLTAELEQKGARRVLAKVHVHTAGPVRRGACGSTCSTLGVKCAGTCGCGGTRRANGSTALGRAAERTLAKVSTAIAVSEAHHTLNILGPPTVEAPSPELARVARLTQKCVSQSHLVRFAPEHCNPGLLGFFLPSRPSSVYVVARKDLSVEETARIVLHELGHALGHKDEDGANRFAADWLPTVLRAGRATDWQPERIIAADIGDPQQFPAERHSELDGRVLVTRKSPNAWVHRPYSVTRTWHEAA